MEYTVSNIERADNIHPDTTLLVWDINVSPKVNQIPTNVKFLAIGEEFNQILEKGSIPHSVKYLIFGRCIWDTWLADYIKSGDVSIEPHIRHAYGADFNQTLGGGQIPNSVTYLNLGASFNMPLKVNDIPNSVTHLTFGRYFNQPLDIGHIPNSVTHLTFGYCFNQPLDRGHIPGSVGHLTFGDSFNRELKPGYIPHGVKHLIFGKCFTKQLCIGAIPDSVTHLTLGSYDNNIQEGHISKGVTHLTLGRKFNKKFEKGHIPNNVKHLSLGWNYKKELEEEAIPSDLITIRCSNTATIKALDNISRHICMCFDPCNINKFSLSGINRLIYVKSGEHDKKIMDNQIENVYYVDTIEKDGTKYLVVHGDDYVPYSTAKSARK